MDIVFIGDKDTGTGFSLAGVKKVFSAQYAQENLKSVLSDDAIGVVIVTERFAENNRGLLNDHKASKRKTPLIVEIPDMTGPMAGRTDHISELIKRAVGTDIST